MVLRWVPMCIFLIHLNIILYKFSKSQKEISNQQHGSIIYNVPYTGPNSATAAAINFISYLELMKIYSHQSILVLIWSFYNFLGT